jgi:hypothetical protein
MHVAAQFDPVAYSVDLMRGALLGHYEFRVWQSLGALVVVIVLLTWDAVRVLNRGEDDTVLGPNRFSMR